MKLKIIGRTYTVEEVDGDLLNNLNVDGLCMPHEGRIVLAKGMSKELKRESLIHEICHAMWDQMGLSHGKLKEERVVDAFGKGFSAFIADNEKSILHTVFGR